MALAGGRPGWGRVDSGRVQFPWTLSLPQGPIPFSPAEPPRSLTDWLFLLYLAGALGLALWYLGCALRLSLRVSPGRPWWRAPGGRPSTLWPNGTSCPAPGAWWSAAGAKPLPDGIFAPALVLPMGWEPDEKVILHELLHLKHRDLWAGWLTAALRCLHWCDPLLWLVFDKVDNDREALCDQRVLERLEGEDRRDYGRVLLSMADSRTVRVPGATTMANGARAIQARIQAIARFKRFPREWPWCPAVWGRRWSWPLAVGGPAPGGETDPVTVSPRAAASPASWPQQAQPGRHRGRGTGRLWQSHAPPPPPARPGPSLPGITVQEDGLPQALEQYREALRLPEEHPEQLHRWWRSGPVFRGWPPTAAAASCVRCSGSGIRRCRWGTSTPGRTAPLAGGVPVPHGAPPARRAVLDSGEAGGDGGPSGERLYDMQLPLCGPVTWSGEADSLRLEVSAAQIFWRLGTAFWAVSGSAPSMIRPPSLHDWGDGGG